MVESKLTWYEFILQNFLLIKKYSERKQRDQRYIIIHLEIDTDK